MMSNQLREQVLAAAAASAAPTRAEVQRTTGLVAAVAAASALGVFLLAGGARPTGRPMALLVATAALSALIAVVATGAAARRPASPRGLGARALLAIIAGVPLALLAGKLLLTAAWTADFAWWPTRPGLRCLGLSMAVGAAPLCAALWTWRWREVRRPRLTGAALGVAAGACAWFLVDLWCPVAHPGHLALGHVLPMALLALGGAAARTARH